MKNKEDSLFTLMRLGVVIQNFNKNSERKMGLSLVQWCTLQTLIDMPGVSAHALAKSVGVHPSTITQTLKRLQRKQLVFSAADPCDSRRKMISITRQGKDFLLNVDKQAKEWSVDLLEITGEMNNLLKWAKR